MLVLLALSLSGRRARQVPQDLGVSLVQLVRVGRVAYWERSGLPGQTVLLESLVRLVLPVLLGLSAKRVLRVLRVFRGSLARLARQGLAAGKRLRRLPHMETLTMM